jgi:hypothetical protein
MMRGTRTKSVSAAPERVDWRVRTNPACWSRPIISPLDAASRISRLAPEEADL